ncbi:MAG: KUP/HAK/KT family potassium transporter [Steroidobacteraceae bacterium]
MSSPRTLPPAVLGALGIVFGDIGTSPLYAFRESFHAAQGTQNDALAIYGLLSLIFWALALIVALKYVIFILRADNDGEGGILSLVALAQQRLGPATTWSRRVLTLGLIGTALFYCDALITPAVTILSAAEGMETLDPGLGHAVLPMTLAIVVLLFALQKRGTGHIGRLFGPVMVLWFLALAVMGVVWIQRNPAVLQAVNPAFAGELLVARPGLALVIFGAVFLAVTGGEALYADMGHFGRLPVRIAWLAIVWPALLLNYFGQAALMLGATRPVGNPFFEMAPAPLLPALVILATLASVIASQATISGAFSITRQAVQLDLLPRLRIVQTSAAAQGQIYVPAVNLFMLVAVILFVLGFGSSGALSGAYGAAVVGTMLITTVIGAIVAQTSWNWPLWRVILVFGLFALVDLAFVAGNATKIDDGGWVPLVLAAAMCAVFFVWRDGRRRLRRELARRAVNLAELPRLTGSAARVPGTAVYLVSHAQYVPTALLRNLQHNHVYHELNVILHMEIARQPRVDPMARTRVEELFPGTHRVYARFGFMETPDVGEALRDARRRGLAIRAEDASFFVGWHLVRALPTPGWRGLRTALFARLQRRSAQAAEFFHMPAERVVVLATEVPLR